MEDQFWFKVCQNGPHSSSIISIVSIPHFFRRLVYRSLHHGGLSTPTDRAERWLL